jgi:hypothetical protein
LKSKNVPVILTINRELNSRKLAVNGESPLVEDVVVDGENIFVPQQGKRTNEHQVGFGSLEIQLSNQSL